MTARRSITIEVVGTPIMAGSKRPFPFAGKDGRLHNRVTDDADRELTDGTKNRGKNWSSAVRDSALAVMGDTPPLEGPLELEMCFRLLRRRGHYTGKGALKKGAPSYPDTKPDLTKLLRRAEDAITGIVFLNDSRVVRAQQSKDWCEPGERPGVTIIVTEIEAKAALAPTAPLFAEAPA